jgi:N-methylhydantoinase B
MNKNNLIDDKNNIQNQVMWNRLLSVVEEQGQTLVRTAFSPIVRECGDISAGVFESSFYLLNQTHQQIYLHIHEQLD